MAVNGIVVVGQMMFPCLLPSLKCNTVVVVVVVVALLWNSNEKKANQKISQYSIHIIKKLQIQTRRPKKIIQFSKKLQCLECYCLECKF